MQRKSFGNMECPIARNLERVGEWWSILILRDAFLVLCVCLTIAALMVPLMREVAPLRGPSADAH